MGFTTGHYIVLLQHSSRLGWVHLWRVGKACMWTPRWGNILTLQTPVYDLRHERSYEGDTATRQRKLGSHTPPCHRRMVITRLFSVFLAALQRRPVLYHTRWLLTVLWLWSSGH